MVEPNLQYLCNHPEHSSNLTEHTSILTTTTQNTIPSTQNTLIHSNQPEHPRTTHNKLATTQHPNNHLHFFAFWDAFIQSDLQCIQAIHFCQYVCSLGITPTTFCAANAMLYHWATGTPSKTPCYSPSNHPEHTTIRLATTRNTRATSSYHPQPPRNHQEPPMTNLHLTH